MQASVNNFIRRNLYSLGGLVVVSGVFSVYGIITEAIIGYCAGLIVCTLLFHK